MSHSFSSHEKSVRKQWLALSIIAILAWPLITLGFMTFLSGKEHLPAGAYGLYAFFGLATLLIFYGLYRCAYVKPGTRFLTFFMIVGSLFTLKATVDALRAGHDVITLIALAFNVGLFAWWLILSLKLRKMNKRVR